MHLGRPILLLSVLTLYVAQILGGQALHRWQCLWVDTAQGERSGRFAVCCHADSQGREPQTAVGEGAHPCGRIPHDATHCWVCQHLGQPQETTTAYPCLPCEQATAAALQAPQQFCPADGRFGFQSRAPPVI